MTIFHIRYYLLLTYLLMCVGCSTVRPLSVDSQQKLLSGQALFGREIADTELPDEAYLAITPEMERFAENATRSASKPLEKISLLHEALLKPVAAGGQGIRYSAFSTEVPADTFAHRSANCLSFTLLFVALARHLDLKAYVNEVDIPPSWDMRDDSSVLYLRHVNAIIQVPYRRLGIEGTDDVVIDLEMNRYRATYLQRIIPPDVVEAQFYGNRAAEILAENNVLKSFLYLRKALQTNGRLSYLWNNLGNLYYRQHLVKEAELAYLQGLTFNSHDLTIMNNLAVMYRETQQIAKAERYYKIAQQYRQANPYHQYALASAAFAAGNAQEALIHLNRVFKYRQQDPRFYQLASAIYHALGDEGMAANMRKKYEELLARGYH